MTLKNRLTAVSKLTIFFIITPFLLVGSPIYYWIVNPIAEGLERAWANTDSIIRLFNFKDYWSCVKLLWFYPTSDMQKKYDEMKRKEHFDRQFSNNRRARNVID